MKGPTKQSVVQQTCVKRGIFMLLLDCTTTIEGTWEVEGGTVCVQRADDIPLSFSMGYIEVDSPDLVERNENNQENIADISNEDEQKKT